MQPGTDQKPYDLFVSYAHVDNANGWVTDFVKRLKEALAIRSGGTPLDVYFDTRSLQANTLIGDIVEAARRSRLFLAVGSRAYAERDFTKAELTAFDEVTGDPSRIFVIETLPLLAGKTWPAEIKDHARQCFFTTDEADGTQSVLSFDDDKQRYTRQIDKLAENIVQALARTATQSAMVSRERTVLSEGAANASARSKDAMRVLIAQANEALEDEVEELRAYLEKANPSVTLLPERGYPQDGSAFKASFLADLDRADLVVQLLGKRRGRTPPDLPEGYTVFQCQAARENSVPMMQWHHPHIAFDEITDDEYAQILTGPDVTTGSLRSFMADVSKRASQKVQADRKPNGSVVYIHASESDMEIARQIGQACAKYKLFCHLPQADGNTISSQLFQERLASSHAVLLLYCNAEVRWARQEAEEVYKYWRRDGQVVALCLGPPPDKPDMNVVFPGARVIDDTEETEFLQKVETLLKELV